MARPLALTPTRAAALIAVDALGAEEDEEEREEAAFRVHLDRLVACYQASSFCSAPPLPCELSCVFLPLLYLPLAVYMMIHILNSLLTC